MAYFEINGCKLFYEVKGDLESEHCIAFFNGVMASTSSWSMIEPVFEKMGYKLIFHDFKGQLKSDKPDGPYTFEQHCEEAKALFDALNVTSVHIIGTSYGGEIAMKFAMLYPEVTASISIIDSVSETDTVMEKFVLGWKTLCDSGDGEAFFWGMAPSIYGPRFMAENLDLLTKRAIAFKDTPQTYFMGQKILYDTFVKEAHFTSDLSKIKCPALIICGEDDILKKPMFSKIIADHIPQSEYVLIPDCGHVAIFEKPEVLQSLLLGFIMKQK